MLFSSHIPSKPLGKFVERIWMCADQPLHSRERIVPSGTIELVVNLRDDEVRVYDPDRPDRYKRFPGSVVSGTYTSPFIIDPSQHASMMGVHFKPGGAFRFFGAVIGELADTHLALEELWGPFAVELRERLCAASTPDQRFSLMEEMLVARLCPRWEQHAALPIALDIFGKVRFGKSIQSVAQSLGLSHRRFIQVFTSQVGLTPKMFCRVLRFQQARTHAGWIA